MESFKNHTPCGAGNMMAGLMFLTPILSLVLLVILAIINLFSKKNTTLIMNLFHCLF